VCTKLNTVRNSILNGNTTIGIELGSTRIKTVLVGPEHEILASGSHEWENENIDGIWTYSLEDIWKGVQDSYKNMADAVEKEYGVVLKTTKAIGVSAMMHGYMVFDKNGKLLTPFRTWRNNITGEASGKLTELFNYPIPQRWSIAHLYQAILKNEEHISEISFMTTLAGYVHWKLTGKKVLGINDASGVFPIDINNKNYNKKMLKQFNEILRDKNIPWNLEDILPEVLEAGEKAGELTTEGVRLLDVTGRLEPGIFMCPPEGDAGTGMVATNCIAERTGNVSAGTSVFAMIVLDKELSGAYPEIDLVTTPTGKLVAMVHSNNCTSDYDAWIGLFGEAVKALGFEVSKAKLYDTFLSKALEGDRDCGGLLSYGYISGEHITNFEEGRPMFIRKPDSNFNLANFFRTHLFASLAALRIGLNILFEKESVKVDEILGHGGFFKTREAGQRIMAAATRVPVSVMETAGEGGAWGIAILASYMANKSEKETLEYFLNSNVFKVNRKITVQPVSDDVADFDVFMDRYIKGLVIERSAVDNFK